MTILPRDKARLVFLLCLLVAGYFTYTAVVGAIRNNQLAEEHREALQNVHELEAQRSYLQGILSYVKSDQYVEQQARRQLGYVRDGEVPFVIISPSTTPEVDDSAGEWWERLFPR